MAGSKIPRSSLVIHLKSGHAQFNRNSDIFGLQIFPESLVSRPLVKGNEDPRNEGESLLGGNAHERTIMCRQLFVGRAVDCEPI